MKVLIAIVIVLVGQSPDTGVSSSENTGLLGQILEMLQDEDRSWAKPIEQIDTGEVLEKIDTGILSYHKADWFVKVDSDE
jgi:hypothetical protein